MKSAKTNATVARPCLPDDGPGGDTSISESGLHGGDGSLQMLNTHHALSQSSRVSHWRPRPHFGQLGPPQSTSVSWVFCCHNSPKTHVFHCWIFLLLKSGRAQPQGLLLSTSPLVMPSMQVVGRQTVGSSETVAFTLPHIDELQSLLAWHSSKLPSRGHALRSAASEEQMLSSPARVMSTDTPSSKNPAFHSQRSRHKHAVFAKGPGLVVVLSLAKPVVVPALTRTRTESPAISGSTSITAELVCGMYLVSTRKSSRANSDSPISAKLTLAANVSTCRWQVHPALHTLTSWARDQKLLNEGLRLLAPPWLTHPVQLCCASPGHSQSLWPIASALWRYF